MSSNWSSASSTNTTAEIAPGETIATSSNANQPGFQQLAQAYTMLNEFGGRTSVSRAEQVLVTTATSLVTQGVSSMTTTEAEVGVSLGQVTQANATMSSQMAILQTQIGNLDDIDANSVATQLNTLTTQIIVASDHRAAAETQPRAISSHPTNRVQDVRIRLQRHRRRLAASDASARGPRAGSSAGAAARGGKGRTWLAELVTALFQLRRLWSVFLDDLNSPETDCRMPCAPASFRSASGSTRRSTGSRSNGDARSDRADRNQPNHPRRIELRRS